MKIPSIKKIAETYGMDDLRQAETHILEGRLPHIEIEGDDEGEQLTHVIAAIEIKTQMDTEKIAFPKALRNYTKRVRNSIT